MRPGPVNSQLCVCAQGFLEQAGQRDRWVTRPPGPDRGTVNGCCAPAEQVSCCDAAAKAQCCGTGPAGSSGCGCEPSNPAEETSTPGKVTPEQAPETSGSPTGSAGLPVVVIGAGPVGLRCTQTSISLAHS